MKNFAIINQKGGVGKTTITVNVSYQMAINGYKVLIVDLDPQAHTTAIFGDQSLQQNINNIFLHPKTNIKNLIKPAKIHNEIINNLYIISSSIDLALASENIASKIHKEKILKKALQKCRNDFDYCLIDCPPTLGSMAINGIYAANTYLIPITYSRYSLDGVADLFDIIETVIETNQYNFLIIKNCFDGRTSTTNQYINDMLKPYTKNTAKTCIRKTESINQAAIDGMPIVTFDHKSNGVIDFKKLTQELTK